MPIIIRDIPPSAAFNTEFEAVVELRYPARVDYSALLLGDGFDLVEGGRRVGRVRLREAPP